MGKISTSPRYMIDIIGPDLLSLVELGGGGAILKIEVFVTYERVTRS